MAAFVSDYYGTTTTVISNGRYSDALEHFFCDCCGGRQPYYTNSSTGNESTVTSLPTLYVNGKKFTDEEKAFLYKNEIKCRESWECPLEIRPATQFIERRLMLRSLKRMDFQKRQNKRRYYKQKCRR